MLTWLISILTAMGIVFGVMVVNPPGAVRQCRDAIERARTSTIEVVPAHSVRVTTR